MKTLLVVNPRSANGQTGRRWVELFAQVSRKLGDVTHVFTEGPLDATRLATRGLHDGADCVVAVGGDGTLNEVVNGFFEAGAPINPRASLGLICQGTGGDFRRTFGWDTLLDPALDRLAGLAQKTIDVGRVDYVSARGEPEVRHFVNVCSLGVSGQVDHEVNKGSKALGGKLSFMLGSVRALLKYQDRDVEWSADGRPFEHAKITTLAAANGRYFGGGMLVAPEADPCDGLLDLTFWTGYGLTDFAFKGKSLYDGSHVKWAGTKTARCRTLEARSEQEVLLDVDGEQPGRLPCRISMSPHRLSLRV